LFLDAGDAGAMRLHPLTKSQLLSPAAQPLDIAVGSLFYKFLEQLSG